MVHVLADNTNEGQIVPVAAAATNNRNVASGVLASDPAILKFVPPTIVTVLKNENLERIIEVCIWLPSGLDMDQLLVFVAEDMQTLKLQVRTDDLMTSGIGMHSDLLPPAASKEHRKQHVRVHHWNCLVDDLRSPTTRRVPPFEAEIPLPEKVCSKQFRRMVGKESEWGSRHLVLDLLVQEAKFRPTGKRTFDLVSSDDI